MIRKHPPITEEEAAMPVTQGACRNNRVGCGENWMRYIKLVGIVTALVLGVIGTLAMIFYNADIGQREALASVRERVSGQEEKIQNIDRKTDEMRQDIKELLRRR